MAPPAPLATGTRRCSQKHVVGSSGGGDDERGGRVRWVAMAVVVVVVVVGIVVGDLLSTMAFMDNGG
jgi:hypothetical protein